MEEFNLSKKIAKTNFTTVTNFIRVKDVKEFIRLEGYLLQSYITREITWYEMCDKRRKLIGEELTKDVRRK